MSFSRVSRSITYIGLWRMQKMRYNALALRNRNRRYPLITVGVSMLTINRIQTIDNVNSADHKVQKMKKKAANQKYILCASGDLWWMEMVIGFEITVLLTVSYFLHRIYRKYNELELKHEALDKKVKQIEKDTRN